MPDIWMDVDANLSEVPVNIMPLLDSTDFKTRKTGVAHNASGMDLVWNFVASDGSFTQTAVTPTAGGTYDWTHQGDGMYTIEIPATGGASINNNTEGYGWFTGICTGVLPWRGPIIGFRNSALNGALASGRVPSDVKAVDGSTAAAAAAKNFWAGLETGTAQSGADDSITLRSGASSVSGYYDDMAIVIVSGTGAGQVRRAQNSTNGTTYNGSTKVLKVTKNWATNPDDTSVYQILGRIE